jgi:NAD(P)H-nitrite reductase large subunit
MDLDGTLCYCFRIPKRKIVNFVKQTRPARASRISECFGAGTGCGWCIPFLKRIHREIVAGDVVEAEDVQPAEYEALRRSYLEGIREGTRARHSHDRDEGWDVSRYFSRPTPADPEPDIIS